jgi:hypothetical protein
MIKKRKRKVRKISAGDLKRLVKGRKLASEGENRGEVLIFSNWLNGRKMSLNPIRMSIKRTRGNGLPFL